MALTTLLRAPSVPLVGALALLQFPGLSDYVSVERVALLHPPLPRRR